MFLGRYKVDSTTSPYQFPNKLLDIVKGLDFASQKIIKDKLSRTSTYWTYYVKGNKLEKAGGLSGLQQRLQVNQPIFKNMYKAFSLDAHPTSASAYKVLSIFEDKEEGSDNIKYVDASLSFCITVTNLAIYDYCAHFPIVKNVFFNLPQFHKEVINSSLRVIKGPEFVL